MKFYPPAFKRTIVRLKIFINREDTALQRKNTASAAQRAPISILVGQLPAGFGRSSQFSYNWLEHNCGDRLTLVSRKCPTKLNYNSK